ncbi:MAG: SCO1664 family protein [Candidatus Dormibacteria bacterium]
MLGRLAYSSNGTYLVRCGAAQAAVGAVYKPAAGERPLWDFPSETLHQREVAAYELSRWLGWNLVPVTVSRPDGPLGPGSLQLFINHDPEQHYFTLLPEHRREFRRIAFFDMLTNNADRKAGHCIADASGRVWVIDHGLTFHAEPKLRTVIWDFAGKKLPRAERLAAARLARDLADRGSEISRLMASGLSAEEVESLRRRAADLAEEGLFPEPNSAWAFPWPLV